MKKAKSFWASPPMRQVTPKSKLELPRTNLNGHKLVKTATHLALAGVALGVGLAAYDSISN